MNKKKLIQTIPFLILAGIVIYTWIVIITTDYFATSKHQIGLGLFIGIAILYFFKFRYGIIFTGIFIALATFNVIAIFPVIISSSYFVKIGNIEISTPCIQWESLLLLILFFGCTGRYLSSLYTTYKKRNESNGNNN